MPVLIAAAKDGRCRRKTTRLGSFVLKLMNHIEIRAGSLVGSHHQDFAGYRLLHCRSEADSQELIALREKGHDDCCLSFQNLHSRPPVASY